MGYLQDIEGLLGIAGEGLDWVIDQATNIVVSIFNTTEVVILAAKAKYLNAIRKWFRQTNGVIKLLIILAIGGVILTAIPLIEAFVAGAVTLPTLTMSVEMSSVVMQLTVAWNTLKAVWAVLTVLDERFEKIEIAFKNVLVAVDSIIGTPIGFVVGVANAYELYVRSLYTMMGFSPEDARLKALTNISQWANIISEKVTTYAKQPGLIIDLLLGMALRADQGTVSDFERAQFESLVETVKRVEAIASAARDLRRSYEMFKDAFPDELRKEVDRQLKPVTDFMDDKLLPFLDKAEDIIDNMSPIIEELVDRITDPITADVEKLTGWIDDIKQLLGMNTEQATAQLQILSEITSMGILPHRFDDMSKQLIEQAAWTWNVQKQEYIPTVEGSGFEITGITTLPPFDIHDVNDWYVAIAKSTHTPKPAWQV